MAEALNLPVVEKDGKRVTVELLTPDRIATYWSQIAEELQRIHFLWGHRYTLEYFHIQAMTGALQVWAIGDEGKVYLVAFTEIRVFPVARELNIFLVFGSLSGDEDIMECIVAAFENFARSVGCVRMTGVGRPGWERKMKRFGVTKTETVVSRSVVGSVH